MVDCLILINFPGGSVIKNPPANVGNAGSIPGLGKSRGEGNGNPLQYVCLLVYAALRLCFFLNNMISSKSDNSSK